MTPARDREQYAIPSFSCQKLLILPHAVCISHSYVQEGSKILFRRILLIYENLNIFGLSFIISRDGMRIPSEGLSHVPEVVKTDFIYEYPSFGRFSVSFSLYFVDFTFPELSSG